MKGSEPVIEDGGSRVELAPYELRVFFFFTGTWAGEDLIPIVSKEKQNVPNERLNEKANPWFPSSLQSSKHLFPMDGKSSSSLGVIAEC